MKHWTPPPIPEEPARKPWEIAVDVAGLLLIGALIAWLTWVAVEPAIAALAA